MAWLWGPLLGAAVLEALLGDAGAGLPWWHRVPGVQALAGLGGCVLIVVASKRLGKAWLQRPEPAEPEDETGPGARAPGIRT
jgi:hypothetical protein